MAHWRLGLWACVHCRPLSCREGGGHGGPQADILLLYHRQPVGQNTLACFERKTSHQAMAKDTTKLGRPPPPALPALSSSQKTLGTAGAAWHCLPPLCPHSSLLKENLTGAFKIFETLSGHGRRTAAAHPSLRRTDMAWPLISHLSHLRQKHENEILFTYCFQTPVLPGTCHPGTQLFPPFFLTLFLHSMLYASS